jgi:hypothetical protein
MSADYEVAEEDDPHGVIGSEAEPMYSNPGEVLQGIREVEPYREWKLGEREGDA